MSHILSSINSDISSRLAGLPVALILANTFLVNAKSSIESLLTWMDSFYQELQAGDSSSKDAWLLVCSCVRCYFKELRKVRAPAQAASNMSSPVERAGSYIWAMAQSHRISSEFMSHRWREHPAVAGVINYHLFRFMVPLTLHNKLKGEVGSLTKDLKERQAELSKLATRLKILETKK